MTRRSEATDGFIYFIYYDYPIQYTRHEWLLVGHENNSLRTDGSIEKPKDLPTDRRTHSLIYTVASSQIIKNSSVRINQEEVLFKRKLLFIVTDPRSQTVMQVELV